MRILYYDCFAGISGDMNLAAMLELGVDKERLVSELAKLNLPERFEIQTKRDAKCGIHGTRVDVQLPDQAPHAHHHRGFTDIRTMIEASSLAPEVKRTSVAIFRRLGEAEAHVHGCSIEEVHFHEVGAVDSIVDIVGAAICYHALSPDRVLCSTIELGGGFVNCAHGKIPIPAPATVELLQGIPTRRGTVQVETTTPTGAAILAELVDLFTDTPAMTLEKTAYGIGHRDMTVPNLLRVQLAQQAATPSADDGLPAPIPAFLLECSIDDMSPELLGGVMERLFEAGASDVNFLPATMKKNRLGTLVSVLASPEHEAALRRLLLTETSTLGVKRIAIEKTELERRVRLVDTPHGSVHIKEALLNGHVIKSKPEYDDCQRLAAAAGLPLQHIYRDLSVESQS
jgi:uncharacterized protein (TIGR00299 family) protein